MQIGRRRLLELLAGALYEAGAVEEETTEELEELALLVEAGVVEEPVTALKVVALELELELLGATYEPVG